MANKPFGVDSDNRIEVPNGLKNEGVEGGGGIMADYMNQALFETQADHIWGTQSQVTVDPAEATFYTDGSGNPLDAAAGAVTINEDDKILIRHNVTQTANLLFDAGGVKFMIEMYGGVTLDMDTYDLTLGGSGDEISGDVRLIGTGTLTIEESAGLRVTHTAMTIDKLAGDIIINNASDIHSDFSSKNLAISAINNTQASASADNIIFIDEFGVGTRVNNINKTFDTTVDRIEGTGTTNELASTWYQMWMDSAGVIKLAPDLVSITDGTTTGKLVDSAADFVTYLVQVGDIVYNITDLTQTTVTAIDDLSTLSLADDIFVSGEDYKIRMLSPPGLGNSRARIGSGYNNASSNLDDSTYTQIQEAKSYSESAGDFTIGTITPLFSEIMVYQTLDWTGKGSWKISGTFYGTISTSSRTGVTVAISGVTSSNNQGISIASNGTAAYIQMAQFSNASSNMTIEHANVSTSNYRFGFDVSVTKKPTFHS